MPAHGPTCEPSFALQQRTPADHLRPRNGGDDAAGTPAYTAPEALSTGDFGPASDQFSLAATLYEAATGARAFGGDDAIVTAGKVSSDPPPPLHDSIGPEPVVRALDAALQRGLAKAPADRFPSCAELGQEVARAIESEGAARRTISGRAGALLTPVPGLIEIERPPLSSRLAAVERAMSEHSTIVSSASGETPRPSIFLRERTHRFQNIAAGVALVVIIGLVLLGRRSTPSGGPATASDSSRAAAASTDPPAPTPRPHAKPTSEPHPTSEPPPKPFADAPLPLADTRDAAAPAPGDDASAAAP